ncbi:MAG: serine/threonine protein kinase [Myxococcales bacterium]|nr:serine/threonine protein kinase [Myxococcales bacterium]
MEHARLGRYELVSHLATGGMGRVSLARTRGEGGFERHVVIKALDLVEIDDAEATEMFLDEARLLGMLHHQHIAAIHEVCRDEDGRLFLVLEYVHGHSAHDVWERALDLGSQLPLDFVLTLIAAAAAGLHYAHTKRSPDGERLQLVHRDVTLSNLMIGFDGGIKVIDFGIAKAAVRTTRTQAGFIKGKLGYMAPEQLRGKALDARTDVFALGIVLYELTTMRRAFRDVSDRVTVERIKAGTYARPSQIVPDYPAELEAIVMRALRVNPEERFESADELRRAIEVLGHQLHLVLGDGAVVDAMSKLFPDRAEPWQRRATTRAETESSIEVEWEDPHAATTRVAPHAALATLLAPAAESAAPRPTTEGADLLVIESEDVRAPTERASGLDLDALISEIAVPAVAPAIATPTVTPPAAKPPAAKPPAAKSLAVESSEHLKSTAFIRVSGRKRARWPMIGAVVAAVVAVTVPIVVIATREDAVAAQTPSSKPAPTAPAVPTTPPRSPAAPAVAAPAAAAPAAPAAPVAAPSPPASAVASPSKVHVTITSTPPNATVLLDQRRLGRTPFDGDLDLAPGAHIIKVRLRGRAAQKRTIELVAGAKIDEAFSLVRARADVAGN